MSKLNSTRKAAAVVASLALAFGGISAATSSAATAKVAADWSCMPTKAKPVTVRMIEYFAGPARTPLLNAFARAYEAKTPGVKIDLISPSQADSPAKITQLIQANNVDIVEPAGSIYSQAVVAGQLADIAKQFKATKAWKYLTPYTQQMAEQTTKGKIYGIGNGYYTKASFVRADRFKAAGIPIPVTWQDIYNAKSMQKDNQYVYAMRGARAAHSQALFAIHAYLAPNLNETGLQTKDGKSIFATAEAQTALDLLLKIWKEAAPAASISWGYPEMVKGFHTGVANYLIQDNEVIQIVEDNFEPYSKGNWVMTQIPKGPTGYSAQFIGAGGLWSITQSSKCKNVALGFLDYISQDPQASLFARAYGVGPVTTSAAKDPFFKEGAWAIYSKINADPKELKFSGVRGPKLTACYGKAYATLDTDMAKLFTGDKTTAQVLKEWSALLGGPDCID
ncbi:MAG: extracellular solute-binding protein [Actinobacteria bacterium]|nr:extracellular solute-binding protein [Actinomycetota bacterium]